MGEERQIGFNRGVRACIAWLHQHAETMNDPHARGVINSAAFALGVSKPDMGRSEGLQPPVVEVDEKVFSSLGASKAPSCGSLTGSETPSGGWQDIRTAPKDGTPILAFCVHANARYAGEDFSRWTEIVRTRWIDFNGGGWTWNGICGVLTHWRPLPPPPTDCQTSGGEA